MMIVLCDIEAGESITLNAGPDGYVQENTRRLSRSATLDGGCVITDGGLADSDRTLSFSASGVTPEDAARLWAFFKAGGLVNLATIEGFFSGYVSSVTIKGDAVAFAFMVYEKIV